MAYQDHILGRADTPAANRNRAYEHEIMATNRRLDHLIQEHRAVFGSGSINGPQISDWRKVLFETQGLKGLQAAVATFEGALKRNQPLAMDWWGPDD